MIGWDPGFWWGNSSWGDKDGAAYEIQLSRDPYRCNTAERRNETKSWRFTAEYNTERGRTFYPWVGIVLHHTNTDVAFFSSKSVKYGGGEGGVGESERLTEGNKHPIQGGAETWSMLLLSYRTLERQIKSFTKSSVPQNHKICFFWYVHFCSASSLDPLLQKSVHPHSCVEKIVGATKCSRLGTTT